MDVAADGAKVIVLTFGLVAEVGESFVIEACVDFFRFVGKMEDTGGFVVALCLSVFEHRGIHGGELISFSLFGCDEVFRCSADSALSLEFGECVNGLGFRCGAEKAGDVVKSFFFSLCGEAEILTVGL